MCLDESPRWGRGRRIERGRGRGRGHWRWRRSSLLLTSWPDTYWSGETQLFPGRPLDRVLKQSLTHVTLRLMVPSLCYSLPHSNLHFIIALMRPFRGGEVTHNGVAVYRETVLKPGDVIGLGSHFLFLYRDPRVTPAPPLALTLPWQADASTTCCPSGLVDRQEALRQYLGSTEAVLKFHSRHADSLLQVRWLAFVLLFFWCHGRKALMPYVMSVPHSSLRR